MTEITLADAPVQGEILHITDMTVWECWSRAVSLDRSNILTPNSKIIEMKRWKLFYGATERLNYVDCFPQIPAAEQKDGRSGTDRTQRTHTFIWLVFAAKSDSDTHTHTETGRTNLPSIFLVYVYLCIICLLLWGFFFWRSFTHAGPLKPSSINKTSNRRREEE